MLGQIGYDKIRGLGTWNLGLEIGRTSLGGDKRDERSGIHFGRRKDSSKKKLSDTVLRSRQLDKSPKKSSSFLRSRDGV